MGTSTSLNCGRSAIRSHVKINLEQRIGNQPDSFQCIYLIRLWHELHVLLFTYFFYLVLILFKWFGNNRPDIWDSDWLVSVSVSSVPTKDLTCLAMHHPFFLLPKKKVLASRYQRHCATTEPQRQGQVDKWPQARKAQGLSSQGPGYKSDLQKLRPNQSWSWKENNSLMSPFSFQKNIHPTFATASLKSQKINAMFWMWCPLQRPKDSSDSLVMRLWFAPDVMT